MILKSPTSLLHPPPPPLPPTSTPTPPHPLTQWVVVVDAQVSNLSTTGPPTPPLPNPLIALNLQVPTLLLQHQHQHTIESTNQLAGIPPPLGDRCCYKCSIRPPPPPSPPSAPKTTPKHTSCTRFESKPLPLLPASSRACTAAALFSGT